MSIAAAVGVAHRHAARPEPVTATLQIAEESNISGNAVLDGDYPGILCAIAAGVAAARNEANACGYGINVGINTTPLFGPAAGFLHWNIPYACDSGAHSLA